MRQSNTREITLASLLVASGILVPIIFHFFNMGGPIFLPMHLPVLVAGMVLSPIWAAMVGIATPILSSLLTGMPPVFPMLPIMVFELANYALVVSICRHKLNLNMYLSLVSGMVVGRIVAALVVWVLVLTTSVQMDPLSYFTAAVATGLPGIAIQLALVVPLALFTEKFVINGMVYNQ